MSRIELKDTTIEVVTKMSNGNPGAIHALMDILQYATNIDPDNMLGVIAPILTLDTYEIYGTDIYVLYNDKCNRELRRFMLLIRATQLGVFPRERLKQLAADQRYEHNISDEEWSELDVGVCKLVPNFAKANPLNEAQDNG